MYLTLSSSNGQGPVLGTFWVHWVLISIRGKFYGKGISGNGFLIILDPP